MLLTGVNDISESAMSYLSWNKIKYCCFAVADKNAELSEEFLSLTAKDYITRVNSVTEAFNNYPIITDYTVFVLKNCTGLSISLPHDINKERVYRRTPPRWGSVIFASVFNRAIADIVTLNNKGADIQMAILHNHKRIPYKNVSVVLNGTFCDSAVFIVRNDCKEVVDYFKNNEFNMTSHVAHISAMKHDIAVMLHETCVCDLNKYYISNPNAVNQNLYQLGKYDSVSGKYELQPRFHNKFSKIANLW